MKGRLSAGMVCPHFGIETYLNGYLNGHQSQSAYLVGGLVEIIRLPGDARLGASSWLGPDPPGYPVDPLLFCANAVSLVRTSLSGSFIGHSRSRGACSSSRCCRMANSDATAAGLDASARNPIEEQQFPGPWPRIRTPAITVGVMAVPSRD